MTRIAIVGFGYWGPNLARNFKGLQGRAEIAAICELSSERLRSAAALHPEAETFRDVADLLQRDDLDAVAVATPVRTHFQIARLALEHGKHVLVEKPLCETSEQARELIRLASEQGLVLMVDHTFPYTAAVQKLKELLVAGTLGELYYYDSVRVNLGRFQSDVNVIWDLAVHDLAILDYLIDERPVAISATGVRHVRGQPESIAYLTLFYDSPFIAHLHVNWLAPVKVRQTLLGGSRRMVVWDDLQLAEKIKIYDKGITFEEDPQSLHERRVGYRAGDMHAPHLATKEALSLLASDFLAAIEGGSQPIASSGSGLRVVEIMEAADRSLRDGGGRQELVRAP